ncbi:MAG: SCP2 sterol-binding domain-containing protein [Ruminiclostridium sp.]|nr:SCP2 sterol-binding domain-containing protein [Ruminiclostridium sp.]
MAKSAYEKVYETLKKSIQKTNVSDWDGFFAFQFNVTGDAAGTFYAKFEKGDNKITVENFSYDNATAYFTADADTFNALVEGKLAAAKALKSGKLIVDGNTDPAGTAEIFSAIAPKKASRKTAAAKAEEKKPAAKKPAAKKPAAKKPAAKTAAKKPPARKAAPKAAAPKTEAVKAEVKKEEAPKAEAKKTVVSDKK